MVSSGARRNKKPKDEIGCGSESVSVSKSVSILGLPVPEPKSVVLIRNTSGYETLVIERAEMRVKQLIEL